MREVDRHRLEACAQVVAERVLAAIGAILVDAADREGGQLGQPLARDPVHVAGTELVDRLVRACEDRRGGEQFKLGKIKESIDDFNTFIKSSPKDEAAHWRRGISFYYAGKYDEGAKQFVDGQIAYGTDVENAFWHYLCVARKESPEKARKGILPIELSAGGRFPDTRVPMKEIYDLIRAKGKPADVLAAVANAKLDAEDKNEATFYANLYLGLYYDADGNAEKSREHMTVAVEKHKISHYMWDVANVHLKLMKKK